MNIEDANIANAERDADPVRWHDYDPNNGMESRYESLHSANRREQPQPTEAREDVPVEEAERESSISSSGSSVRDGSQIHRSRTARTVSRSSTRMEHDFMEYLDRHPTAVKRMQDRQLYHSSYKIMGELMGCRPTATQPNCRDSENNYTRTW